MGDLTKHFNKKEFACKHCGVFHMNPSFVEKIEAFRSFLNIPIFITSGYRCEMHNDAIPKASKNSQHVQGNAVDCYTEELSTAELALAAIEFGFRGVIWYPQKNVVHIDERPGDIYHIPPPEKEFIMVEEKKEKPMWKSKTVRLSVVAGILGVARAVRPDWALIIDGLLALVIPGAAIAMREGIEKAK